MLLPSSSFNCSSAVAAVVVVVSLVCSGEA
jgi:hypothetical protein